MWFQNRRAKWRKTERLKEKHHKSLVSSGRPLMLEGGIHAPPPPSHSLQLPPPPAAALQQNEDIDVVDDEKGNDSDNELERRSPDPTTTTGTLLGRKESPAVSLFSMASLMKKSDSSKTSPKPQSTATQSVAQEAGGSIQQPPLPPPGFLPGLGLPGSLDPMRSFPPFLQSPPTAGLLPYLFHNRAIHQYWLSMKGNTTKNYHLLKYFDI